MAADTNSRRILIAAAAVLLAAAAFWMLLLSPKRKEATELASRVETQQQVLAEAQTKATEAAAARKEFPNDYREMVLLGKAVPEGDETASLIVQIQTIANRSHIVFENLTLGSEGGSESGAESSASTAQETGPTSNPVPEPPTEAEASLLPLGASVGKANLGVMPYKLNISGEFGHIADFIHDVERLIKTREKHLTVEGRLLTFDGFTLTPDGHYSGHSLLLSAEIMLDSYLAPPSADIGATGLPEAGPIEGEVPLPAAETAESTTATPSSYTPGEAR